jgi:hypothetical protein
MQVLTMHLNGAFSITSYCICRNSGWSSGRGYQPGSECHQFYICHEPRNLGQRMC